MSTTMQTGIHSSLQMQIEVGMRHQEASFLDFLRIAKDAQMKIRFKENGVNYFNYDLNVDTWNLLVNKQIYMKFERLLIEKHMSEKMKREREIKEEIEKLEKETILLRDRRKQIEKLNPREEAKKSLERQHQSRHRSYKDTIDKDQRYYRYNDHDFRSREKRYHNDRDRKYRSRSRDRS